MYLIYIVYIIYKAIALPFFSIYVPARLEAEGTSFEFANEMIDLMDNIIDSNSDYFFKVDTSIYLGANPWQELAALNATDAVNKSRRC